MASRAAAPTSVKRKQNETREPQPRATAATPQGARSRGRGRSDTSRTSILRATLKLLEGSSLQQISIEAIAREAGVGKATIYRWWPSKAAVAIDAFVQYHVAHTHMSRGVPAREALECHLRLLVEQFGGRPGRLVAQILAEGQSDPAVLREFRERFFYGRREAIREVVEQARKAGEFRADLDTDGAMDIMYAPIYFRLLLGHLPLDRAFAQAHASSVLKLLRAAEDEVVLAKPRKRA